MFNITESLISTNSTFRGFKYNYFYACSSSILIFYKYACLLSLPWGSPWAHYVVCCRNSPLYHLWIYDHSRPQAICRPPGWPAVWTWRPLKPKELSSKSGSKMGSNISFMAAWTTLSFTVRMPSCLWLPSFFGIWMVRTISIWYLFFFKSFLIDFMKSDTPDLSTSLTVRLSTPATVELLFMLFQAVYRMSSFMSSFFWWLNRFFLLLFDALYSSNWMLATVWL